MIDRQTER